MDQRQYLDEQRRRLIKGSLAGGALAAFNGLLPAYAAMTSGLSAPQARSPDDTVMDIAIKRQTVDIAGARATGLTLNDSIPGPVVELYEGTNATLRVHNYLEEESSIHWHGILLPFEMDGVPGVVFPGIAPGTSFEAQFPVRQYGTYWYHSHSGFQEQLGVSGPLVIHPREPEPFAYERDYVVFLSDWTFEDPHDVMMRLKKMSDYYNYQQRTVDDFFTDVQKYGFGTTMNDRLAWNRMRMMPSDIADVTGHTYTYLMNGLHPEGNWTGLFNPGERVRLRIINGSAMSYFNVRIPGLPMSVVQMDGQNVQPVETDEIQIGVAETFDVIVLPTGNKAYTLMAESMDRSGYARGTLAPRDGMAAPVPPLRERPLRTMVDMGMDMSQMPGSMMEHAGPVVARHGPDNHGAGNTTIAMVQRNRLAESGTGLEGVSHRVLTYADMRNVMPMQDTREPSTTIELHLTGNMERYMWSFDGKEFHEVKDTVHFPYGERIRLILVNDTMMEHPIHLHGMFMELENGQGDHLPFKHTISVKPAERVSLLITADEPGRWAFHCHFLYHMEMGMFRVVEVA